MYYFKQGPSVFVHWCYQPVTIGNYLLPAHTDHYPLGKSEQPLPQHFKIPTLVLNPYSLSAADPQSFAPLT